MILQWQRVHGIFMTELSELQTIIYLLIKIFASKATGTHLSNTSILKLGYTNPKLFILDNLRP